MAFFAAEWGWQPSEIDELDASACQFWLEAADRLQRERKKRKR